MDKISYSLSDANIYDLLKGQTSIIQYSLFGELWKMCRGDKKIANALLDALMQKGNNCVILYNTDVNYGHWCCIINHGNRMEFFDSYGIKPDYQLEYVDKKTRIKLAQDEPYLSKLIKASGKKIEYNSTQLQEFREGVNTCGKHCVYRILHKEIPIDSYGKILLKYGPDRVVTKVSKEFSSGL